MGDRERDYLRAAYALARTDHMHAFDEGDVADRLGLAPGDPGVAAITGALLKTGYVNPLSKGRGMGRRYLTLTGRGTEEGERLSDPVEQRKELRGRFLKAVYELADGDPAAFVRWEDVAPAMGWDDSDDEHKERCIALAEYAERAGLVVIEVDEGTVYRITAKGVDQVEGNRPEPSVSNVFNVSGNLYNPVIGTHNTANFSGEFDFSTVERRIEAEGSPDREELRQIVAEVRGLLEHGETLDRGSLARWNDKLQEYGWLAGAVAGWLLNFSTQDL